MFLFLHLTFRLLGKLLGRWYSQNLLSSTCPLWHSFSYSACVSPSSPCVGCTKWMAKVEIAQVGKRNCSIGNKNQNWKWFQNCLLFVNTIVHLKIISAVVFAHVWSLGEIFLTTETYSVGREKTMVRWGCCALFSPAWGCLDVYKFIPSGREVGRSVFLMAAVNPSCGFSCPGCHFPALFLTVSKL